MSSVESWTTVLPPCAGATDAQAESLTAFFLKCHESPAWPYGSHPSAVRRWLIAADASFTGCRET